MIIRIVVDLPDPFGPRKPVTRPDLHLEGQVIDGHLVLVPLRHTIDLNHNLVSSRFDQRMQVSAWTLVLIDDDGVGR